MPYSLVVIAFCSSIYPVGPSSQSIVQLGNLRCQKLFVECIDAHKTIIPAINICHREMIDKLGGK